MEGIADAIVMVLKVREVKVPEEVRARIHACARADDRRRLDIWLGRAVAVTSSADLFDDEKAISITYQFDDQKSTSSTALFGDREPTSRVRPQIQVKISLALEGPHR